MSSGCTFPRCTGYFSCYHMSWSTEERQKESLRQISCPGYTKRDRICSSIVRSVESTSWRTIIVLTAIRIDFSCCLNKKKSTRLKNDSSGHSSREETGCCSAKEAGYLDWSHLCFSDWPDRWYEQPPSRLRLWLKPITATFIRWPREMVIPCSYASGWSLIMAIRLKIASFR